MKHSSRDSEPADQSIRPRAVLPAFRKNQLNPNSCRRRASRDFAQL